MFNKIKLFLDKIPSGERKLAVKEGLKGKFYLEYPDGHKSVNMHWDTAKKFQRLFGGVIKHVDGLL